MNFKTQKEQEHLLMESILNQSKGTLNPQCWNPPLKSKIVSKFASRRTLPGGHSYFHTGVDLRARTGTPIKANTQGEVVFAEHMIVPGNLVVLNHGDGLYSRYMHLSQINVNVGQRVAGGDLIGKTGATGRVEAPHLHWEVIWKGNHANPHRFLQVWEQLCDRE